MPTGPDLTLEVQLERAVAGGVVLGRDASGRIVLAEGGLPGERVVVAPDRDTERLARGRVVEVLDAAPQRVDPPCPLVAAGCGGCDLQHATTELQQALRVEVVRDALAHLAGKEVPGVADLTVGQVEPSDPWSYRTTMRLAVVDGRLGLRHRRSNDVVAVPECLVAHELLAPVLQDGRFPGASEVTVRASVATGEVFAIVSPKVGESTVPAGVRLLGTDALKSGERAWMTEVVDGHSLRVSAQSFFQASPGGAAALGRAVGRALGDVDPATERIVDLYGGVGLFTVLLGARRAEVVERSASSTADARLNTEELGAKVVRVAVRRWRPSAADGVVADPSRKGLGNEGADAVTATGARRVALVSCDPAALGRDVALLARRGYRATGVEIVDMFPHTHHVEAVTSLERLDA